MKRSRMKRPTAPQPEPDERCVELRARVAALTDELARNDWRWMRREIERLRAELAATKASPS